MQFTFTVCIPYLEYMHEMQWLRMCYISFHFVWYAHQSQALKVFCHEVFYKHSTILPLLKVFLYIVFCKSFNSAREGTEESLINMIFYACCISACCLTLCRMGLPCSIQYFNWSQTTMYLCCIYWFYCCWSFPILFSLLSLSTILLSFHLNIDEIGKLCGLRKNVLKLLTLYYILWAMDLFFCLFVICHIMLYIVILTFVDTYIL